MSAAFFYTNHVNDDVIQCISAVRVTKPSDPFAYVGLRIKMSKQVIECLISDGQACCEEFGIELYLDETRLGMYQEKISRNLDTANQLLEEFGAHSLVNKCIRSIQFGADIKS